jgi:hypothetical protein
MKCSMVHGCAPEYLCNLIPPQLHDLHNYNTRRASNTQTVYSRTSFYRNSFLPSRKFVCYLKSSIIRRQREGYQWGYSYQDVQWSWHEYHYINDILTVSGTCSRHNRIDRGLNQWYFGDISGRLNYCKINDILVGIFPLIPFSLVTNYWALKITNKFSKLSITLFWSVDDLILCFWESVIFWRYKWSFKLLQDKRSLAWRTCPLLLPVLKYDGILNALRFKNRFNVYWIKHKVIKFHEMFHGCAPEYLCNIVPPQLHDLQNYNTRRASNT